MDDWKERLRAKLAKMGTTTEELFTPPFHWSEITIFLKASIMVAEEFYPDAGSGASKLELVMEIWDYHDERYKLVEQLDNMVDFKKLFGGIVGGILEQFDAMMIRALIEQVIIPMFAGELFPHWAKKMQRIF